jgi:hypothetical protein
VTSKVRNVLSSPVYLLQLVTAAIMLAFTLVCRAMLWLRRGCGEHVLWPILVAKRTIQGVPVWSVMDLVHLGKQPASAKALAIANADPRLMRVTCSCGGKKCIGYAYGPRVMTIAADQSEATNALLREIDQAVKGDQPIDVASTNDNDISTPPSST